MSYKLLKAYSKKAGADLFGVADISKLKEEFIFENRDVLKDLNYGVSIGVRLLSGILETIENSPTAIYFHHYRQVNNLLDRIALGISFFIQKKRFKAMPIPASQIIDWKNQLAQVSHRAVAFNAGLGWRGRSNLLVNPIYGSQVRYATILTNYPLDVDSPIESGCGDCYKCVSVCPVGAIDNDLLKFNREKCLLKLKEFSRMPGIGQSICGICVKVCH